MGRMNTHSLAQGELEVHPLAAMVPEMSDDQYAELLADVERHGLLEPIVLYEGKILDGRHRYRACKQANRDPVFEQFTGSSPAAYVVSKNLKRRHLTSSQRAALVTEFLPVFEEEARKRNSLAGRNFGRGVDSPVQIGTGLSSKQGRAATAAGSLVGVSGRLVAKAKRLQKEDPEMFNEVKGGHLSLNTAEEELQRRSSATFRASAGIKADGKTVPLSNPRDKTRADAHKRKVIDVVSMLSGLAAGLDHIEVNRARAVIDDKELKSWDRSLADSLTKLREFRSDLQKGRAT